MTCSAASTLKPQASIPLPSVPGLTIGQQQALKLWGQQILSQIQAAAGVTGVNVIPQQYALLAGSSLPPISSTSNCTVSLDTSTVLFGAGSYKVTISGTPATVTLSVDTAWPLHLGWQWLVSFFQQASAAVSGQLTITTPTKAYSTAFTTTTSASGWERLYDTLNLGADTSSSFGLSFTFTGGTGQTVWLDGLMMEPYFGLAIQPSPFISTSGPLLLDNNPDGDYSKILSTHTSGNVAYNYKGVWSSATAYVVGDEVIYGQSYWLALTASTNSAPATSNANWQVVGSYSGYQGAWSSTTAYIAGAEVTYNGNYWVCVTANTNSAPTTSNANWQIAGPATLQDLADGTARFAVTNAAGLNGVSHVDSSNRASGYLGGFDPRGSWAPLIGNPNFAYTSTTTSFTITWSAFTVYRPDGSTSSIAGNSTGYAVTGLAASTSYRFYPYIDESTLTVQFVTGGNGQGSPAAAYPNIDMNAAASTAINGHMTLQSFVISTPASGTGGGGGGSNGSMGYCLTEEMWLDEKLQAKDAGIGDWVYVAPDDGAVQRPEIKHIREVSRATEACYRLVTESGAAVCASASTPMTLRNGSSVSFSEMAGKEARVLRNHRASWERVVSLESLGERTVVRLSLGGRSFFAGEDARAMVATHNYAKP